MKLPDPNRIAVYLTAFVALATALVPALTDAGLAQVAGYVAAFAGFAAIVGKWLTGWQQYESAVYQDALLKGQAELRAEQINAVSKPGTGTRINLPR